MSTHPEAANQDPNVLIIGANIIGIAIMRAAVASECRRVAVWERKAHAVEVRSLVRIFGRYGVPLYIRCEGAHRQVHQQKDIKWRGPFTLTIVCDTSEGDEFDKLKAERAFYGKVISPREAPSNLLLSTEGREAIESLMRALYIIKTSPGLPAHDAEVRRALGIADENGAVAIEEYLNDGSEVPA